MKWFLLCAIFGLAGCGPNVNVKLLDGGSSAEFTMENFPCTGALELIKPEDDEYPDLYALAIHCQDGYDWRKMERLGDDFAFSVEDTREYVSRNKVIYLLTREQLAEIAEEWVRSGGGYAVPPYLGF